MRAPESIDNSPAFCPNAELFASVRDLIDRGVDDGQQASPRMPRSALRRVTSSKIKQLQGVNFAAPPMSWRGPESNCGKSIRLWSRGRMKYGEMP
jgi:hypothetical protein